MGVKNENSSNVLGHQCKTGHFQCKAQIRQHNWVSTPCKGPNPHPIYRGRCARGQKFWFLNCASNHIMWPLIWKLMLHWFQKCYSLHNIYTMKIVTFYMLGEKQFLQRKLSHSISSSDKTFPKIAKFIRKWFLFQYTWWKF